MYVSSYVSFLSEAKNWEFSVMLHLGQQVKQ